LWSREPAHDGFALREVTDEVARAIRVKRVVEAATGSATIAGYTVLHERDRPPRGVAIVDVGDARAVVDTIDAALVAQMQSVEMCGAAVQLHDDHSFSL
jgi:hypothetical protein